MNRLDLSSRILLAEILRRAAYDWVLYRSSRRLRDAELARDAYVWIFEEGPGHPDWVEREKSGWSAFSFLTICDSLDMDPQSLRDRIKKMTPSDVTSVGRPPVRRKRYFDSSSSDVSVMTLSHAATVRMLEQDFGDLEDAAVEW